jgi:hypothetical protein
MKKPVKWIHLPAFFFSISPSRPDSARAGVVLEFTWQRGMSGTVNPHGAVTFFVRSTRAIVN